MNHLANITNQYDKLTTVTDMDEVLGEMFEQRWWAALQKQEASRGNGRNKLRFYRLFKSAYGVEEYLLTIMPKVHRRAFALFRCGVAPIRLETGRYDGVPEEQRVCFHCPHAVENEVHVLLHCPVYAQFRAELFKEIENVCPSFKDLTDMGKVKTIFSDKDCINVSAKTCFQILKKRKELYCQ